MFLDFKIGLLLQYYFVQHTPKINVATGDMWCCYFSWSLYLQKLFGTWLQLQIWSIYKFQATDIPTTLPQRSTGIPRQDSWRRSDGLVGKDQIFWRKLQKNHHSVRMMLFLQIIFPIAVSVGFFLPMTEAFQANMFPFWMHQTQRSCQSPWCLWHMWRVFFGVDALTD